MIAKQRSHKSAANASIPPRSRGRFGNENLITPYVKVGREVRYKLGLIKLNNSKPCTFSKKRSKYFVRLGLVLTEILGKIHSIMPIRSGKYFPKDRNPARALGKSLESLSSAKERQHSKVIRTEGNLLMMVAIGSLECCCLEIWTVALAKLNKRKLVEIYQD